MSARIRIIIILLVFAVGTLGLNLIKETWTLLEALYMTITTVGYGEVKPLSAQGQIFTIIFIIFGLSTAAIPFVIIENKPSGINKQDNWIKI